MFLLTKRTNFANLQLLKNPCNPLFMRSFRNSSYTFFPNHMKTLFLYYQYYKIPFILIILRIRAIYIYCIINIIFVYVFLFFANKMQTIWYVFIFMSTSSISVSIAITDICHNSFYISSHFHMDMDHFFPLLVPHLQ